MNNGDPGRIGRFDVIRRLGAGRLGRVYLARDGGTDATVAIKRFGPPGMAGVSREAMERLFVSEARKAATLTHPGIVTVREVRHDSDAPYIVMETIYNGRSLARHCESGDDRLPLEDVVRIVRRVADALHFAHERGVLHRDIKPRNILLDVGLEPKLVDFGLSSVTTVLAGGGNADAMAARELLAPEQLSGHDVGREADIYGLGALIYQLLAGRHPFGDTSTTHGGTRHVAVRKYRSDAPRVLEMITERCLAEEPEARYPSALHLAANLEVAADQLALTASAKTKREVYRRARQQELFAPFSERELKEMVVSSSLRTFRAGDEIIGIGDTARCLYVVLEGEVGVRRDALEFAHLGPGEYFGEVGLLTGKARTTPVVALDRSALLVIPARFLDEGPPACQLHLKSVLLRNLAGRLAQATETVC